MLKCTEYTEKLTNNNKTIIGMKHIGSPKIQKYVVNIKKITKYVKICKIKLCTQEIRIY